MSSANNAKKIHGFTNDALADYDAVALSKLLKNKDLKASEIVQAAIERANKVEPILNAFVTKTFDKALFEAQEERDGFFAGIPMVIKDLTFIKGMKTYFGSEAFLNAPVSKKTDPIAKQIFAQGFVHLGNSSLPEFGFTCSTEFPHQADTVNPWNIDYSCGGSSGGSAALVAAGVIPIAHSADGGGSTRIPAACCGLVGLKASRDRLLKSDLFKQQVVDVAIDGVVSRTVRDTAHFYAEAEKYYKNPKLKEIGLITEPTKNTYKIGFTNKSLKGLQGDAKVEEALNKTVQLLEELGHTVKLIEIPVPDQFVDDFIHLWEMLAFYTKHFGKPLFGKHYDAKKLTKLMHGLAKNHPKNIWRTPFFVSRLKKTYHDYKLFFSDLDVDFLLTPTLAHTTPKLGHLGADVDFEEMFPRMTNWACYTPYSNACGGPSISLPMGHDDETDLPIGMMFWANHGEERMLLDIAYQLEEAHPWKKITQ